MPDELKWEKGIGGSNQTLIAYVDRTVLKLFSPFPFHPPGLTFFALVLVTFIIIIISFSSFVRHLCLFTFKIYFRDEFIVLLVEVSFMAKNKNKKKILPSSRRHRIFFCVCGFHLLCLFCPELTPH